MCNFQIKQQYFAIDQFPMILTVCAKEPCTMLIYHTYRRGEEQNREEGEMAQKKLGGGKNGGKK